MIRFRTTPFASGRQLWLASSLLIALASLLSGCGGTEKEPEPTVAVQVMPAKRGSISLTVFAEAVVSPLQQAVITPKISSTISKFYVQRGSHVKQGQVLAILENADLSGAAEESKENLSKPKRAMPPPPVPACRNKSKKQNSMQPPPDPRSTLNKRSTTRARNFSIKAPFLAVTWIPPKWRWRRRAARTNRRKNSLPT